MLADPLNKAMNAESMAQTFMTGKYDMTPTPESLMIKEKNRNARKAKKTEDPEDQSPTIYFA